MAQNNHAAGHQVVGKVVILYGTVKAISPDGAIRLLMPNSPIFADDRIVTESDGSASIVFDGAQGNQLDLGRMMNVSIDQDVYGTVMSGDTTDTTAEVAQIQQALLTGDQPIELEAPAAGGPADAGGTHPVFIVTPTGEEVQPTGGVTTTGVTFGTTGAIEGPVTVATTSPVLPTGPGVGSDHGSVTEDASNPTLSTTGTLTVTDTFGNHYSINTAVAPIASEGAVGNITIDSAGHWTYSVANSAVQYLGAEDVKVEQFKVQSVDGTTHDIEIKIYGTNDGSQLTNDTNTVAEDHPATGNVLTNDSDVDNTLTVASFQVAGDSHVYTYGETANIAGKGSLTIGQTGEYTFTPVADWNGDVPQVTYTVNTGSTSTLDIKVTPVDDASVMTPDTNTVAEDHPATGNVLTNDSDVDNTLTVASFQVAGDSHVYTYGETANIAGKGSLTIGQTGEYTFTPVADWNGDVPQVTYTVNTGSTSTLDIKVTPVDDASVMTPDTNTVAEDHPATGNVLTNDSDVDNTLTVASFQVAGDSHVYTYGETANIAGKGSLTIGQTGEYTFTPVADWNGDVPQVTYTVNTGSTSTLDIKVTPVDDASVMTPDTNTVAEDHPATGNVLTNDSDVDNTLTVASFQVAGDSHVYTYGETANIAGKGSLTIGQTGEYTFTPVADWNGDVPQVTYTVNTGSTSTLDIKVTPVDDASVMTPDTNTVAEDHPATGNVLTNDSDVDNTLTVASFQVAGDSHVYTYGETANIAGKGSLTIGQTGEYTFTPVADWNGDVPQVTYTVNTGSTSTLDIKVTPVDDASVMTPDTNTVAEDHPATGNVLTNDSDVDNTLTVASFQVAGDSHVYTYGETANIAGKGSLTIGQTGEYTFTPVADWNGDVPQVTYTVNTGSTSTLDIKVTPVDDASVMTPDTNTVAEDHPATGNVLTNDSDVDNTLTVASFQVAGDSHVYTYGETANIAGKGSLTIGQTGEYTFTPVADWNGDVPQVTYTVNTGSTSTLDIKVTPVDDASVMTPDTNTVAEDHPATGNVLTNDSDVDNTLTVASFQVAGDSHVYTYGETANIAGKGSLTIGQTGEYTFTPVADWNGDVPQVTYTVNTGSTSTLDIKVTPVDDASVMTPDTNTVAEDHPATGNVLTNDSDVDNTLTVASFQVAGDSHVYTYGETANIAGKGSLTIGQTGEYTFTPVADWNGDVPQVTYTVNTGSTSTLDIKVTPVDDASVMTPDTNTVAEDHPATGNVLTNDSDVDNTLTVASFQVAGDSHVYTYGETANIAGKGSLTIGQTGEYTFTPVADWNGDVPQVTYTVNTGSTSTLDIKVTPVDDASVMTPDTNTVAEDHPATGNVLTNDSDVDNTLTVASFQVAGDSHVYTYGETANIAGKGSLTIGQTGEYTFTPVADWNGDVPQVTYTVNTGSTSTLDIKVTPVDDASVMTPDTNTVAEDHPATGNVLTNDSDVDNTLTVASFQVAGDSHVYTYGETANIAGKGSLTIGQTGEYTFTPVADWNGDVPQVTYTVNTGSTSTLDIKVTPVDDASVMTPDTNTVAEDHPATGNVLTNDSDVDNTLTVASFQVAGDSHVYTYGETANIAGKGSLTIGQTGEYTFTPVADWNGDVPQVTYTVNTGSTSTLDIKVTPVDDASVMTPDTNTVAEDHPATGNVLTNDSDVDNTLTVASFQVAGDSHVYTYGETANIAGKGSLTIGQTGEYTFTPVADWNGDVPQVTYTVNTGSTSTLDIKVTPVDDASVMTPDTNTVAEDHPATGNVLTNDSDVDNTLTVASFQVAGDSHVYTYGETANIAGKGSLTIGQTGEYTFTPVADWNGDVPQVTYTVNTGSTSTLDIKVTPVDDASVMTPDTNTVAEDHPATGNVLTNDSDVDNTLTVASFQVAGDSHVYTYGETANIAGKGSLTIGQTGEYTFTPVADWNGDVPQVTYTVNTGSTSTLDIKVTPVDDASVMTPDTNTVAEDHPATGNVLTNDSDVDNTLTVASFQVAGDSHVYTYGETANIAGKGSLTIGQTGEYTFTPVADWNGDVPQVTYTVNTGSTSTLDIKVTPVDDASVMTPDTNTVAEDHPATGNVLTNDSDVDNTLTVASFQVAGDSHVYTYGETANIAGKGSLTIGQTGEYTFTPVADWNGDVPQVTYTVNTGSTSTLDIKVTPVDDGITLTPVGVSVNEANLSDGSAPSAAALTQTGSLSITAVDGVSSVHIGNTDISIADLHNLGSSSPIFIDGVTYGNMEVTGYTDTATGGTLQYSFTLNDNVLNSSASVESYLEQVLVSVTDANGTVANANLGITIVDDHPVFTMIDHAIVGNENSSTAGVLYGNHDINFGADSHGSINVVGDSLNGKLDYVYTTHADGSVTAEAYSSTNHTADTHFFDLTINTNGTYAFDMVNARATFASGNISLLNVNGGAATNSFVLNDATFNAVDTNHNGSIGNAEQLKPTSVGFGVGNGNVDVGEQFNVTFAHGIAVDTISLYSKVQAAGSLTMSYVTDYLNPDGTTGHDTGSTTLGSNGEMHFDPLHDFTSITFTVTAGSGKLDSFSFTERLIPNDETLNFHLSATDGDGDVTGSHDLNVTLLGVHTTGTVIAGTDGSDAMIGTSGDDIFSTSGGHDTIMATKGNDHVTDFDVNHDTLDISSLVANAINPPQQGDDGTGHLKLTILDNTNHPVGSVTFDNIASNDHGTIDTLLDHIKTTH
ncbi:tandem-95 repeat protein [Geomonas oryzisoli]|uniref:Tandem-95 repeat protein n=1 Tax=Geomonas oryzisoli TaxID=2847992 RepID=A0ABX8J426_9BACT|nr:Ig-like domain-containing protein [Geomonas oryzisoli]QWV92309.1 tandem-95 repeat protein [Geomonas oryzisoli]